jgi:hypothetical protein
MMEPCTYTRIHFHFSYEFAVSTAGPRTHSRAEALSICDLPDAMLNRILGVHREACFDCTGVSRRFRWVCLEAVGALAGQRWALRLAAERGHVAARLKAVADLKDESAPPQRRGRGRRGRGSSAGSSPACCATLRSTRRPGWGARVAAVRGGGGKESVLRWAAEHSV